MLKCPWPEDIWTMTDEQYVKAVPDESQRTSISGFLMRKGWELAIEDVVQALLELKFEYDDMPQWGLAWDHAIKEIKGAQQ